MSILPKTNSELSTELTSAFYKRSLISCMDSKLKRLDTLATKSKLINGDFRDLATRHVLFYTKKNNPTLKNTLNNQLMLSDIAANTLNFRAP